MLSLQCKATVLVVALTLAVTALASGYLLRSSTRLAYEQHNQEMIRLSSLAAEAASPLLGEHDEEGLRRLVAEIADGAPLLYVAITDAEGRLVAKGERGDSRLLTWLEDHGYSRPSTLGVPVHHQATDDTPAFLDIAYPIKIDVAASEGDGSAPAGRLIGYTRAGMSVQDWERSMASTLDLLTGIGIIAVVVAIPFGFLLVRRIVSPLAEIGQAMQRFSEGKLTSRSEVRRCDEIGELADMFNRMADNHQQTHERIVRLNTELEERVARRTQQLRELASREPLTNLYNRRHFNEVLQRRFSEATRYDNGLSCMMIDLDDFKAVNDAHGHQVGDEVLILAATTIVSQLRTADLAARYGGDEFVVLLPQTEADRARVLGERISERFTAEVANRFPRTRVSMSMGISSLEALRERNPESLVCSADRAMYLAKAAGKSCIMVAESLTDETARQAGPQSPLE